MITKKIDNSTILIVNDIKSSLEQLLTLYPSHSTRVIKNEEKEEFLLTQAVQVIKESYIASNETKYIFLCGTTFRKEAQNSLLKVLEEPPRNTVFILITTSKSSLLPTIYSRLPYIYLKTAIEKTDVLLDIKNIDLKDIYLFLKDNQKISKNDAKNIVETILLKANKEKLDLSQNQLDLFSKAIKLINLNSRPINILTTLLLSLSKKNTEC